MVQAAPFIAHPVVVMAPTPVAAAAVPVTRAIPNVLPVMEAGKEAVPVVTAREKSLADVVMEEGISINFCFPQNPQMSAEKRRKLRKELISN